MDAKRYKVMGRRGSKLTLVNLFTARNCDFSADSEVDAGQSFLGVEVDNGKQEKEAIKNVTYMDNTGYEKGLFRQGFCLMPSLYESYGRTAVELWLGIRLS